MLKPYSAVIAEMNRVGRDGVPYLFVLDYEKSEGAIITHPEQQSEVLFKVGEVTNFEAQPMAQASRSLTKSPESLEQYARRFEVIQKGMKEGQSVLASLTVCTPISTPLTLQDILFTTSAKYQIYLPEAHFVCFSPERFVHITREGVISTDPMKGTITSDTPGAPEVILNDYKETSEHCSVVDLLRRDLLGVATNIEVSRFRYFTEIQAPEHTIYQVSSEIKGVLPQEWPAQLGSIMDRLLPAGSILGAPRESTRALIAEAEGSHTRGYYCGVFGYFDGKELDSSVLIRFIREGEDGQKYYHSGGGITINSELEHEYQEVIDKIYLPLH
ncbi:aminodeoxychorismate synthase component I [uncultured Porphyromonas sp.]|uniref:aminodeoxychorismate synthase component I n=1 Tax=uncultured Porphyromonas sp. TaxID=159274 RepID=UPI00260FEE6E|nr:aminodeoxychorismate synthase component I [uncultured Porphyromonas sp.]